MFPNGFSPKKSGMKTAAKNRPGMFRMETSPAYAPGGFRGGFMRMVCWMVVLFLVSATASLVCAQDTDPEFLLNHREIGEHQRPKVLFKHDAHAKEYKIDCINCHHDYDANGNNKGGEGEACSACHSPSGKGKAALPLTEAFHRQCKSCHEDTRMKDRPKGPVMCGECHVRK